MKKHLLSFLMLVSSLISPSGLSAQTAVTPDNAPSQKNMRIRGLMTYDNKKDVTNYGIYDYTVTKPITRKQMVSIPRIGASGGSVVKDNILYYFDYSISYGYVSKAVYYKYDLSTNQETTSKNFGFSADATEVYSNAAMSVATDPSTGIVYCCCFSYDDDTEELTYTLSTWDLEGTSKKVIAPLAKPLRVLAASADGQLYGITASTATSSSNNNGGTLVRIDKTTGALTTIGDTGVRPGAYFQSATIDTATGKFYWFANEYDEAANLYTVDLTTGKATLVGALPEGDQVVCSYTANNYADGVPSPAEDVKTEFANGSLSGNVTFKMPTEDYSGAPLSGSISYAVSANGEELATGTAQAGAEVSAAVSVKEDGLYNLTIILSNTAGKSPVADTEKYIGYDTPKAVTDLKFTRDGSTNKVTWTAPTEGVNGGYIDASALTYELTRKPDGKTSTSTTNTFSEELDADKITPYYYEVVAVNGTHKSASATSNTVNVGNPLVPPFSEDFSDATALDIFTIIDANNDNKKWTRSTQKYVSYQYSTNNDADDWLITPPLKMEAGKSYTLSYKIWTMRYDELLEVKFGKEASAKGMTITLKPTTTYKTGGATNAIIETIDIVPEETGVYYIGFHAVSKKNQGTIYLDDLSVSAGKSQNVPAQPTDLIVTAGDKGALTASGTFTAPTKTAKGDDLTGAMTYNVLRGTEKIATGVSVNPGEKATFSDTSVPSPATYTYSVICINTEGESKAVEASVYVGEDIPLPPAEAHVTDNLDGTATITWTASSDKGKNGGYVNPDNVKYDINPRTGLAVAKDVSGTTYTVKDFDVTGTQALAYYKIYAHNDAGKNTNFTISDTILSGKPYELPFEEGFTDNAYSTTLWNTTTLVGKSYNTPWYLREDPGVGIDGAYADLCGYVDGGKSRLETPKIDVSALNEATLSFASKMQSENMKLSIEVSLDYGKWQHVADVAETSDWATYSYVINGLNDAKTMRIGFVGECIKNTNFIYIDNVKVTAGSTGIGQAQTDGGDIKVDGNNVTVTNSGNYPIQIFTITGQIVARGNGSLQCSDLANGVYVVRNGNTARTIAIR